MYGDKTGLALIFSMSNNTANLHGKKETTQFLCSYEAGSLLKHYKSVLLILHKVTNKVFLQTAKLHILLSSLKSLKIFHTYSFLYFFTLLQLPTNSPNFLLVPEPREILYKIHTYKCKYILLNYIWNHFQVNYLCFYVHY